MPITVQLKGIEALKGLDKQFVKAVDEVLSTNTIEIATTAKQNLNRPYPLGAKDLGGLDNSIAADVTQLLKKKVTVNAFYASYVEFGTGKYAAAYVATLPADWSTYAAQFRGKGEGTLDQFLDRMVEWVKRKGLIGLTKSGNRRTGKRADADAYNLAYVIVISILRNGVHPHPFLYPAFEKQRPIFDKEVDLAIQKILPK